MKVERYRAKEEYNLSSIWSGFKKRQRQTAGPDSQESQITVVPQVQMPQAKSYNTSWAKAQSIRTPYAHTSSLALATSKA